MQDSGCTKQSKAKLSKLVNQSLDLVTSVEQLMDKKGHLSQCWWWSKQIIHTDSHLDAALSGQFYSCVVVATAQQMLHHHAVHAFLLPQVDWGRLVAAVLLQVLDATLTQLGALIFCLDGLCSLQVTNTREQDIYRQLNWHHVKQTSK